jgi:hypothetical protein
VELFLDSLLVLQTDDSFLTGSYDEVYLLISGTAGGKTVSQYRAPGPNAHFTMTRGDQVSNYRLWDGYLEVGQSAQFTVKIKESDTFGDPTIGEFVVTLRNDKGQLVTEVRALRNVEPSPYGRVSFGSGPTTGFTHYQTLFNAIGGSAVYETAFAARSRAVER